MRVLVIGVTGLIGSAIAARLALLGHAVVGASRGSSCARLLPITHVSIDMARAVDASDWLPHLQGIDALVNCAGVFQDSPRNSTEGVHAKGAAALFQPACARVCAGSCISRRWESTVALLPHSPTASLPATAH